MRKWNPVLLGFVCGLYIFCCVGQSLAQTQSAPHYDVVALRVEFQPDTSRFSTGTGTFSGTLFDVSEPPSIDPLPHDADYFRAHLTFLENYVRRVSDGRTTVDTHLLPGIVRLSEPMVDYAPTGLDSDSDEQVSRLAGLVREAWTMADAQGMNLPAGLDPATTSFAIFHAGVGRDVDLLGTTLDKTPEDLPSLYFSQGTLGRLLESTPVFDGWNITNTMLLPRTESRQGMDFIRDRPFVLELSINGLLAASFFNYLGVPDLFDTETGRSAIGPFGVMDALGIFAYSGLFPPEPSAWTKTYLGWADERTVSSGDVELRFSGDPERNDVVRVPVSDSEYFLIENRHRDPRGDGVRLTVWRDGRVVTESFSNGDPAFNDQTVSGFGGGVVLDVDQYDFALPGGVDENDNPLVGGGLIWHIDELRLRRGLSSNGVNVGPSTRAIDLEEADGPQDIGFPSNNQFGPSFDIGSPFDFWYAGNPVTVRTNTGADIQLFENRFGPDTTPSSDSNVGGPSFVEISGFSSPGPVMSVSVQRTGADGLDLIGEEQIDVTRGSFSGSGVLRLDSEGESGWEAIFGLNELSRGTLIVNRAGTADPLAVSDPVVVSDLGPAVPVADGSVWVAADEQGAVAAGQDGSVVRLPWLADATDIKRVGGAYSRGSVPAVVRDRWSLVSTQFGPITYSRDVLARGTIQYPPQLCESRCIDDVLVFEDEILFVNPEDARQVRERIQIPRIERVSAAANPSMLGGVPVQLALGIDRDHVIGAISSFESNRIILFQRTPDGTTSSFSINPGGFLSEACTSSSPSLADVSGDGLLDVLLTCGDRILALHRTGALIAGYPLDLPSPAASMPVVVFESNQQAAGVMAATVDGSVEGFTLTLAGRWERAFTLVLGTPSGIAPIIADGVLYTMSGDGALRLTDVSSLGWQSSALVLGSNLNWSFVDRSDAGSMPDEALDRSLLADNETYNWPNPIRNGRTNIRFQVRERADVSVEIVDMAGGFVDRLKASGVPAGVPFELEWITEVGSGVYFGRVKARSVSGRAETRLIRMAVIR